LLRIGVAGEFSQLVGQERSAVACEAHHGVTVRDWHRPRCRVTSIRSGVVPVVDHQSIWSSSLKRAAAI
jgi:hypothetical protein